MIDIVLGTGGPRKPDTRFSPSYRAIRTLLGRPCSGAWPDYQSGREHFYPGNAERPRSRSAALAGARLNSHSCTNDLQDRSEEHTSELQSRPHLVCRLLLEKKKKIQQTAQQHATYDEVRVSLHITNQRR